MEKGRTLAFQVSEELFQRVKEYLENYEKTYHRRLTQKEFVISLIEQALEEAEEEFEAARAAQEEARANRFNPLTGSFYEALFDTKGEWFCEDIRKADPKGMPGFDLLCGGFPCQSFSIAGHRGGFDDPRGTLFFEIARLTAAKRPAYLLLENVPGLLNHDGGRTFAAILHALDGLG